MKIIYTVYIYILSYLVKLNFQKNVLLTILKVNMGSDQYTVPDTVADEPTATAFFEKAVYDMTSYDIS